MVLLIPTNLSDAKAAALADRIWYPVWDSGVRLDHAVRTPAEARRVAADDVRALLGMLDVRHVAGDVALTEGLRSSILGDWRGLAPKRLPDLLAAAQERAERVGDVAFALEPDLKESRGGLRDVTVLRAIAASWVADAPHAGLPEAQRALLDVRDALHRVTGRSTDRLVLQEQDAVAQSLGLADADQLLLQVGRAGRAVAYASDVTWHRVERALTARRGRSRFLTGPGGSAAPRLARRWPTGSWSRRARRSSPVTPGPTRTASWSSGRRRPQRSTGFGWLPTRSTGSPPSAPRSVSRGRRQPATRSSLCWGRVRRPSRSGRPSIRLVWSSGCIPEWERVRSKPQRNPIHRFTVDRHLVEAAVRAAALTRRVDRPDLLLVGALLHDLGKGWPGDHTESGMVVVADLAPRMGFDARDTETLVTLVRHHLLLPDTATRRDLDDPATVALVAAAVGSSELLDLLHALTEADALATGPAAWGEWKAMLVADLVARTHAVLRGHVVAAPTTVTPEQAARLASGELAVSVAPAAYGQEVTVTAPDRVGLLATVAGVLSLHRLTVRAAQTLSVGESALQVWTVLPEFGGAPDAAAVRADVRRALDGTLDVVDRLRRRDEAYPDRTGRSAPPARVDLVPGASDTSTVVEVRAHDRPGLLHRVGSALAAEGVDVRAARVSTLGSEVVDVFYLVDADGLPLAAPAARELVEAVRAALR